MRPTRCDIANNYQAILQGPPAFIASVSETWHCARAEPALDTQVLARPFQNYQLLCVVVHVGAETDESAVTIREKTLVTPCSKDHEGYEQNNSSRPFPAYIVSEGGGHGSSPRYLYCAASSIWSS